MDAQKILIIGAGQAGGSAAAALRKKGFSGSIVLAGDEAHRPYERPPLSKDVLTGTAAEDKVFLQDEAAYDALALQWRPGVTVRVLDVDARLAVTTDNEELPYDCCLLATGGRARRFPGVAQDAPNILYLRSLDDARMLRARLASGRRVAIVGGGFLGLEFATAALQQGLDVTVFEAADCLLGRVAPRIFGDWLRARYEELGVNVRAGSKIAAITPDEKGVIVGLEDGEAKHFDFLVVSIGQMPNVELAKDAGLKVDNGIVVDARCETSAPGVYAAGDCAAQFNPFCGAVMRFESWQNAQQQALVAAAAMLGDAFEPALVPWFWSDQIGRNIQMLGIPSPDYHYVTRGELSAEQCSVYGFDGDMLRYVIAVNGGKEMPPLRKLLASGACVDMDVLTDPAISIKKTVKAAMAATAAG